MREGTGVQHLLVSTSVLSQTRRKRSLIFSFSCDNDGIGGSYHTCLSQASSFFFLRQSYTSRSLFVRLRSSTTSQLFFVQG